MSGDGRNWAAIPQSADRGDRKLVADLARQAIVDLGMTRDGSLCSVGRIGINRVAGPFAIQPTPLLQEVTDPFMPLQGRGAPTWTESGTSSIKSASAAACGSGAGKGLPSSRRH